jgi:threonine synthase
MALRYTSTRNSKVSATIAEAIVRGMPEDGGLFVPTQIPKLPPEILFEPNLSYAELAYQVLSPWFDWPEAELRTLIEKAYTFAGDERNFDTDEIVPLIPCGFLDSTANKIPLFLLELFHGKTCAFKDLALSLLGSLLRVSLEKCGIRQPMLLLTATSGDTGSAALAGLGGQPGIRIAVIYPEQGISQIQRLQMTTVPKHNRFVVGLRGNFDDAQRAVKQIFQTAAEPNSPFYGMRLSSANSINIGRLLPQIVYYVKAWRDLYFAGALSRKDSFDVVVPSGNFGDILAAKYAKEMGLPIRTLICASNSNRVLYDFFTTGLYDRRREFETTLSPSMDILVSSNLERLIYYSYKSNSTKTSRAMADFESQGYFEVSPRERAVLQDFSAGWADNAHILTMIQHMWKEHGTLVDPHTATACKVSHDLYLRTKDESGVPMVIAATASPFKFPIACLAALQEMPPSSFESTRELALAENLVRITDKKMPSPYAALKNATIQHEALADDASLVPMIASFARGQP